MGFACPNDRACLWCPAVWMNCDIFPHFPDWRTFRLSPTFCCSEQPLYTSSHTHEGIAVRFSSQGRNCRPQVETSVIPIGLAKLPFSGAPPVHTTTIRKDKHPLFHQFWIFARLTFQKKKKTNQNCILLWLCLYFSYEWDYATFYMFKYYLISVNWALVSLARFFYWVITLCSYQFLRAN